MQQCYDWQSNVLKFTDVNGNKYNLKFRGNKTIVHGDSATGKSLLCTMLKSYINDNNNASFKPYNADNIFTFKLGAPGQHKRSEKVGSGGRACQNALHGVQTPGSAQRFIIGYSEHFGN